MLHLKQQTQIYEYDNRYFTLRAKSTESVSAKILNTAYNSNNNSCNNKQLRKINAHYTWHTVERNPTQYYEDF